MSGTLPARPQRLNVIAEEVPERLRPLPRWVVWDWKQRNGKWDKPPLRLSGEFASVSDPGSWSTFEAALAAHRSGRFDGVGFVLGHAAEDDTDYVGVDLDDCRDPETGAIQDWAVAHLQQLNTYSEVSPSGRGVKALAVGALPGPARNESARLGVEMYGGGRYFTVTGHRLPPAPAQLAERTAELADLYHAVFGEARRADVAGRGREPLADRDLALSALQGLDPRLATGYGDWLRVGMALHAVSNDPEMLAPWDVWSRNCPDKYRDGACERKWRSFGTRGGFGLRSLVYWARQHGWQPPRDGRRAESSAQGDAEVLSRLDGVLAKGAEALFRDRPLLEALGRLAETDRPEFACVRAKVKNAHVSLHDFDACVSPFRQAHRARQPPLESAGAYRVVGGRMVHMRTTRDGPVEVPLGNFVARIAEVVTRDDGAECTAVFALNGTLADGRPLPRLHVPAAEFQRLDWVTTGWHGLAVVLAGQGTRDRTRCAIELLSAERAWRVQYLHTGWREVGGRWVYLHAGGARGVEGLVTGVEVDLGETLGRAGLPEPPSGADLVRAVRASIGLLTLAPACITVPVLGAVYRAPLGEVDFAVHLSGKSGAYKTEFAALGQAHYGASFDSRSLPDSWSSTDNALEELAFAAKDMLVVVDDFKPRGGSNEVQAYHRKADRLFRAVGNHSGRQRLTRDGRLRVERRPRGLVLSTGEEVPSGESLRARLMIEEIAKGDIDSGRLSDCQRDAAAGRYAESMAGYLHWLAGQYAAIRTGLRRQRDELRDRSQREFAAGHARTPAVIADLALGLKYLFDYAPLTAMIERRGTPCLPTTPQKPAVVVVHYSPVVERPVASG